MNRYDHYGTLDGGGPAEAIQANDGEWVRYDDAAAMSVERDVLRQERDHARARFDNAIKLLSGIHSLLYPPPVNMPDGRTLLFRPKDPDPHQVLQELSDRIRALPDKIASLEATNPPE